MLFAASLPALAKNPLQRKRLMNQAGFAAAVRQAKDGIYLNVHTQPGARKGGLRGMHGDAVKIAVHEAAQDGRANQSLVVFVAKEMAVPRSNVQIVSGLTSRSKCIFISGEVDTLMRRCADWISDD